jgi:hypothetical protein
MSTQDLVEIYVNNRIAIDADGERGMDMTAAVPQSISIFIKASVKAIANRQPECPAAANVFDDVGRER